MPLLIKLSAIWLTMGALFFGIAPKTAGISAGYVILFFAYNTINDLINLLRFFIPQQDQEAGEGQKKHGAH